MGIVSRLASGWIGIGLAPSVFVLAGVDAIEDGAARSRGNETVRFDVAQGVRLKKSFDREVHLATRAEKGTIATGFGFDFEFTLGSWHDIQQVIFVDAYGAIERGVPDSITRSFERIEMEHVHDWSVPELLGHPLAGAVERTGRGELEGEQVVFRREEGVVAAPVGIHEARYSADFMPDATWLGEADLSDDCLENLRASADLSGVLPWQQVGVGDHWYTNVEAFRELVWPSGRLGMLDRDGVPHVVPVDERLGRDLDGTLRVELTAVERVRGVRYARLDFRGHLESKADFEYEWELDAASTTYRMEGPIDLELKASIEGYLWWDLDGGHLDTVEIGGDLEILQDLSGLTMAIHWGAWFALIEVLGDQRLWRGKLSASARFERL